MRDDWEWCGTHDQPWAACEHLHHGGQQHWTDVVAVGVALLMALVLLAGLR